MSVGNWALVLARGNVTQPLGLPSGPVSSSPQPPEVRADGKPILLTKRLSLREVTRVALSQVLVRVGQHLNKGSLALTIAGPVIPHVCIRAHVSLCPWVSCVRARMLW